MQWTSTPAPRLCAAVMNSEAASKHFSKIRKAASSLALTSMYEIPICMPHHLHDNNAVVSKAPFRICSQDPCTHWGRSSAPLQCTTVSAEQDRGHVQRAPHILCRVGRGSETARLVSIRAGCARLLRARDPDGMKPAASELPGRCDLFRRSLTSIISKYRSCRRNVVNASPSSQLFFLTAFLLPSFSS